ncbi:hypothetical protein CBR_g11897 [Chara braunii]|uniref:Uncharacterized protein n=1 Tax=Chara braunii TaxID=69332 RepID=A0A388KQP0_CHABU|nr:hypothetical protein CBR_g11897 [Chara braunii]|eukprot:GBG72318.1 hypothetical protein CBR_g11897 [Chara braunii]
MSGMLACFVWFASNGGVVLRRIRNQRIKKVKVNEKGETAEEEKERLRREIAMQVSSEGDEDTELLLLRRRAVRINIYDKRRREPEGNIAGSPPSTTLKKGQRLGLTADARRRRTELGSEAKIQINEIRNYDAGQTASASIILKPVEKLSLSLKHVAAGCAPGDREKYEEECRDLFEALTIDELKEVRKSEKISYTKRDIGIKRLVARRLLKAYDPINVSLPESPRGAPEVPRAARSLRPKPVDDESDFDDEDEDSE